MNYLGLGEAAPPHALGESASADALQSHLDAQRERLRELSDAHPLEGVAVRLEMARTLLALQRSEDAWQVARQAFETCHAAEAWNQAVEACDILFRAEQPGSLSALGQGIWLAVTYPVDPGLTLAMLEHVVDETPDDSDGAAVAAAAAVYVVDLRASDEQAPTLRFFANQLLGGVAQRHSRVLSQEGFDAWVKRLQLDDPERFLPRLRNVVDVLVQDEWWFDRESLRVKLPVN